jgi:hypothetical protein
VLEDLDTIDLVMQGEPGEVIIKIIDGGVTTDLEEFNALLKAKIGQAIDALADDGNYEAAGRPERLRIEVVHRIPRPPFEDGPVYTINTPASMPRPLQVTLTFVSRESRYGTPE